MDITLSQTFYAHECNPLGRQVLLILDRFAANTKIIHGGDPAVSPDAVVFITLPTSTRRSRFLRIHPTNPVYQEDIERQVFLEDHMPWTLAGRVVFINPQFATHGGLFGGKPLKGFTSALANLVGYTDPEIQARRKQAKRDIREERRQHDVRDRYYFA